MNLGPGKEAPRYSQTQLESPSLEIFLLHKVCRIHNGNKHIENKLNKKLKST
jgi:hypothetical protein